MLRSMSSCVLQRGERERGERRQRRDRARERQREGREGENANEKPKDRDTRHTTYTHTHRREQHNKVHLLPSLSCQRDHDTRHATHTLADVALLLLEGTRVRPWRERQERHTGREREGGGWGGREGRRMR